MTLPQIRPRLLLAAALGLGLLLALATAAPALAAVSFGKSKLGGTTLSRPTSLQLGPDGRLYAAQQNGLIKAHSVARTGRDDYDVTATETISLVNAMPNRDDDGQLNTVVKGRLVTGLLVAGTAQQPVIYVVSSDPRIGAGTSKGDVDLDTNSGVLSRLTKGAGGWTKQDLVRGLPRSEENHTANGLSLDGSTLYIAQGGNTNNGAPSNNFAFLPEVALSAAILEVDLTRVPHDLPTLDDPARAGTDDAGDPFGGNDGLNQARLVPGGPVQVHAPGFRNAYDLVRTAAGRLFTIDNGGNAGWGGTPAGEGPAGMCTNAVSEPGSSNQDELFDVTVAGTYGGHPNPTRANPGNVFGAASPVSVGSPVECDFRVGAEAGALASFATSTNGLTEYTASNFGGELRGEVLAAGYGNQLFRLEPKGTAPAVKATLLSDAAPGGVPLDVTAQSDAGPFPGTVWYADVATGAVYVLEPADYDGAGTPGCDPGQVDSDGDGYANADEQAAGTDPCSAADVPADLDGDRTSDRTDDDDDGDGRADVADPFARDAENGLATELPVSYGWENEGPRAGGLLGLGFTGLMTNGSADYADQFDPGSMTAGGAAGVVTVDALPEGDAYVGNTQKYGFQFGVRARPEGGPFVAHTRIVAPFGGTTPQNFQSMGLFVGTGTQDDYVKVVTAANSGTVVQALKEVTGAPVQQARQPLALPGPAAVDLYLRVDPRAATVQASFTTTTGGTTGARVAVGAPMAVPASWFTAPTGLAVGILSTSTGTAPPFAATWDLLEVVPEEASPPPTDGALARDAFARSVGGGWGSADTGGAWSLLAGPAADVAVADGAGRIRTPTGNAQRLLHLAGASARDVDARATLTFPDPVPSGTAYGYLMLRRQAGGAYLRVGLGASGGKLTIRSQTASGTGVAADVDVGVPFTPGAYVLRVQAEGASPTVVRAKAWRAGTPEPATWRLVASTTSAPTEAGTLGVRTVSSAPAAMTLGVDDLVATRIDGASEPPPADPAGLWQTLPSTGLDRQEVAFTQLGGKLYLAGGSTAHQAYDPGTRRWTTLAPLPARLDHIQSVAVGGKVLYIGGLSSWPSGSVGTVFVYDPATDTFTRGADMPRPRGAGGVAVHHGRVFYAGGLHRGIAMAWFDVYDPATDRWQELPDMPTARDHFHAVVLDGRLWAIGGRVRDITATTPVNEAFSFASGTWTTGHRPLPTPRGGFAAAAHGDEVLVIGGESTRSHAEVEAYDVERDAWRSLRPMPTARHGIQAATCGGGIYVAAGGTTPGGANPGQVHEVLFPAGVATPCSTTPPPPPPPDPDAGATVARDGFGRTASGGWGTADAGGACSLLAGAAADLAVAAGEASVAVPAGGAQRLLHLGATSVLDADARVTLTLPAAPATGGHFGYLVLRRQPGGAYVRVGLAVQGGKLLLRTQSSSGTTLVPDADTGLAFAPERHVLRVQVQGSTVRARAWRAGTSEPASWTVSRAVTGMPSVAGSVGVRALTTGGAAATIGVDDLEVTRLGP